MPLDPVHTHAPSFARLRLSTLLLVVVLAGCAGNGASRGVSTTPSVLTAADLERQTGNAYDAIRQTRPRFLETRGASSILLPRVLVVYVDGVLAGDVSTLRYLSAGDVTLVRRLSESEAQIKFGAAASGGAIDVRTRRYR